LPHDIQALQGALDWNPARKFLKFGGFCSQTKPWSLTSSTNLNSQNLGYNYRTLGYFLSRCQMVGPWAFGWLHSEVRSGCAWTDRDDAHTWDLHGVLPPGGQFSETAEKRQVFSFKT
jgi:hypothetical protein